MNRLTNWNGGHAFFPKCFEEPCGGGGCTRDDCEFLYRACEKLARYEDSGLEPEEIAAAENLRHDCKIECLLKQYNELSDAVKEFGGIDRLRELAEAERDGRLVVLPCKVGDRVYIPLLGRIVERKVISIVLNAGVTTMPDDFGKTVFLTREEAEAALEAAK